MVGRNLRFLRHARAAVACMLVAAAGGGCATRADVAALDEKLDRVLKISLANEMALSMVVDSPRFSQRMAEAGPSERAQIRKLFEEYAAGNRSADAVIAEVEERLGSDQREVAAPSGLILRDPTTGAKLDAVAKGTKLERVRRVDPEVLPLRIREDASLAALAWGRGLLEESEVLFPWGWPYTVSALAGEISEATSHRTIKALQQQDRRIGFRDGALLESPEAGGFAPPLVVGGTTHIRDG